MTYALVKDWKHALFVLVALIFITLYALPSHAVTTFRGCFVSGPDTAGAVDSDWDDDVDTMTAGLVGTGSWAEANITDLKNGKRADIETCIANAKTASKPGDEFVFFFSGHGGDFLAGGGEANEGNATDNHILIGDTTPGTRDRISDDQLADELSGFKKSVTISVILDSCFSHTFSDGADDLGSITQVNGAVVTAGDHIALSAASSTTNPTCGGGYTDRFVSGLNITGGFFDADVNKDGTVTTEEATDFASGFSPDLSPPKCDPVEDCNIPLEQFATYFGPPGCGAFDPVCPIIAEFEIPEPGGFSLMIGGLAGFAMLSARRRRRQGRRRVGG